MRVAKPLVFIVALSPFLWLVFRGLTGRLEREPHRGHHAHDRHLGAAVAPRDAGDHAAPAHHRLEQRHPVPPHARAVRVLLRVACTCSTYLVLDQGLAFEFILADIVKRPYITAGMIGLHC